ncbi:MAG TPA: trypsin-like peptidase domain-containing protein [Candidatus Polarisedimenticolia bacterium]|jgi:hypothetical protein|nr:trypsin-like peptidase domain-containing protein [Candidatus Polarisedimenticolia bacterium]
MANATGATRRYVGLSLLSLLVAVFVAVAWTSPVTAGPYAEAPMRYVTEGFTAEEHLQQQAELSRRLGAELPAAAMDRELRIRLTPDEVAAIERDARASVPLKIGLVKALAPGLELYGLSRGPQDRQPGRGTSGLAQRTSDGGYAWAALVTAEGAGAIRLHIEDMSLPRGAELYFYSRDGQAFGPYTDTGRNGTGEFWTETIFATEAILQLRVAGPSAERSLRDVTFRVVEAGLITPSFAGSLDITPQAPPPPGWPCGNAACIVDATCVNTAPAPDLKLAVAKMEWIQGAFIYTCTGGLINDLNPSQDNFFLTANHCVSKNSNAQNVNFYWRFATSSCNATSCPSNSGWPYQTSGSTVSKTGRKGDFSLLHLNAAPPSGSVVLGYNTTPVANSNGIHLYRVSNPNFGPQVYSQHDVDTSAPTCSGWPRGERIYSRDITGAIDGGSSGSPIANSTGQIVGQLSGTCGLNPSQVCSSGPGEDNATVDGAFAFYFSLVQPILAP